MAARTDRLRNQLEAERRLPSPEERKELRISLGVSLDDLAEAAGVSRQAIAYWEAGARRPSGKNLIDYVAALDLLRTEIAQRNGGSR